MKIIIDVSGKEYREMKKGTFTPEQYLQKIREGELIRKQDGPATRGQVLAGMMATGAILGNGWQCPPMTLMGNGDTYLFEHFDPYCRIQCDRKWWHEPCEKKGEQKE